LKQVYFAFCFASKIVFGNDTLFATVLKITKSTKNWGRHEH